MHFQEFGDIIKVHFHAAAAGVGIMKVKKL